MVKSHKLRMLLLSVPLVLAACQSVGVHGHDIAGGTTSRHGMQAQAETGAAGRESSVIALGEAVDVKDLAP